MHYGDNTNLNSSVPKFNRKTRYTINPNKRWPLINAILEVFAIAK